MIFTIFPEKIYEKLGWKYGITSETTITEISSEPTVPVISSETTVPNGTNESVLEFWARFRKIN